MFQKEIFRAYDIRGIVGEDFDEEGFYQIALAFGAELIQKKSPEVILARDARLSSPSLHAKLVSGLVDAGCRVIDIGIVPTPVMYFAANELPCPNGVMLTASHNPSIYNGLKMIMNYEPLLPGEIADLYEKALLAKPNLSVKGQVVERPVLSLYQEKILNQVSLSRPLKVVIDCANGVAGVIAPTLFRALGCEVVDLYTNLDGRFPNHSPDPSETENLEDLIEKVKAERADVGFAFDGDADRVMVIDETGKLIFPDYLLMLLVDRLFQGQKGFKVIHDVKCTRYLTQQIKKSGGIPLVSRTGHSFMKIKMKEEKALIGAEASGHIFWQDRWYGVDDGVYTAARLLEVLADAGKPLSFLMASFPKGVETPEFKLAMPENKKESFMQAFLQEARFDGASWVTIDGFRVEFSDGWGLIRPSNTSPYLTFRFEAATESALGRIMQQFKAVLLRLDSQLVLPF